MFAFIKRNDPIIKGSACIHEKQWALDLSLNRATDLKATTCSMMLVL